jgi:phage terminase small subunit
MAKNAKKKSAPTTTEREDLQFALDGFREIARQSAQDLAGKGLILPGSQGRAKVNPTAKIFRDAVRTIESIRKRLRALEQDEKHSGKAGSKTDLSFLDE